MFELREILRLLYLPVCFLNKTDKGNGQSRALASKIYVAFSPFPAMGLGLE